MTDQVSGGVAGFADPASEFFASGLRLAVIADDAMVPLFGLEVIDAVRGCDEFTLLSCTNTRNARDLRKHAAYYALNLLTIRNRMTALVETRRSQKRIVRSIEFESVYDGAWQSLPEAVLNLMKSEFDVVLKLGMNLLRIPDGYDLPPILSYHHGDPDLYRGRPAGFWESRAGEPSMGQIVQILSNKLDAGTIVASAETEVFPHSYKATLIEAYSHSPLIINQAIANAVTGRSLDRACRGPNYRLPTNITVAKFAARTAGSKARRLAYGAVVEKAWRVSTAPIAAGRLAELLDGTFFPSTDQWNTLPVSRPYTFHADPFFSSEPRGILLEAMHHRTGVGTILLVTETGEQRLTSGERHFSYPATFFAGGEELVLPEIAEWSLPTIFRLEEGRLEEARSLKLETSEPILDPTLVQHEGRFYLFGNIYARGANSLYLWSADRLDDSFALHPASPVRISPVGSRMAGGLLSIEGSLVRPGQDARGGYGNGVCFFDVEELSARSYRERPRGTLKFHDRKGPHTINFRDGEIVFDWYRDRLAPLAGMRRLAGRLRARTLPGA